MMRIGEYDFGWGELTGNLMSCVVDPRTAEWIVWTGRRSAPSFLVVLSAETHRSEVA